MANDERENASSPYMNYTSPGVKALPFSRSPGATTPQGVAH